MKIDTEVVAALPDVPRRARELEDAGADGVITFEGPNDPFFPLALAAANTSLEVYASCCVAFPRSSTHLAQIAWDLHRLSKGRFKLGIATQIRPHVERRFGAVWGKPVPHMRELIEAIRAVIESWHGALLQHYRKVHCRDFEDVHRGGIFRPGDAFFVSDLVRGDNTFRVGAMICFDREVPETLRCLRGLGAELVVCPLACDTNDRPSRGTSSTMR